MVHASLALPLGARDRSRRYPSWVNEVGKLAFAVAVFSGTVGGYLHIARIQAEQREAALPLPGVDRPDGPCTLWFVGSSTFYKWPSLESDLAPWDAHNRGVNGATIAQLSHRLRHEPRGHGPAAIVFYGGENDIANGASAAAALVRLRQFLAIKTERYGALPVIALSLKPSPTRWSNLPRQTSFNTALRDLARRRGDLRFLDIRSLLLIDGRPGPFYVADGVHMNPAGYGRWTGAIRQALAHSLPRATVRACLPQRNGA